MLIDVSRAHFHAKSKPPVFIKLPGEDPRSGEPGLVGELLRTMYGTLDAASGWAEDYTRVLVDADFCKGGASPCHFRHSGKDINLLVHGEDFFSVGRESDLGYLRETLSSHYQLKSELIGPHADDAKEIKVLGRVISHHPWGIQYETDPNHLEIALKTMGLEGCKAVVTPWVKETIMSALERNTMDARRG